MTEQVLFLKLILLNIMAHIIVEKLVSMCSHDNFTRF